MFIFIMYSLLMSVCFYTFFNHDETSTSISTTYNNQQKIIHNGLLPLPNEPTFATPIPSAKNEQIFASPLTKAPTISEFKSNYY